MFFHQMMSFYYPYWPSHETVLGSGHTKQRMVEVRDLTKIRLVMVLLEVVQIAILVGKSYRMRLWAVSRLFP